MQTRNRGKLPDGRSHPVDLHVGQRIRTRRLIVGMTQEELAKQLGLTFQQVQKYEKGVNRVSSSRLFELSQILGVSPGFFFEGLGPDDDVPVDDAFGDDAIHIARSFNQLTDPALRRRVLQLIEIITGLVGSSCATVVYCCVIA